MSTHCAENKPSINKTQKLVIACATVIEEMLPLLPPDVKHRILDFGLHINPSKLRQALQDAIDASMGQFETIILGYGLCSQGVIGLHATGCTLVVPRVDDCIAIFLGSGSAYQQQSRFEPGTYYLTKGWIEVGDSPFSEYERMVASRGQKHADRIIRLMLNNYKRLALINTGQYALEHYRDYAQRTAQRFGLRYEEIEGSTTLVKKMLNGPWDNEFIVVEPGHSIRFEDFFPNS
ncbi:MAG: DUF1638 domain-containing protein [Proteobacteria bacterium]|nr:DUF1638 domain-containing protein [Pseudomonadota bacterium]